MAATPGYDTPPVIRTLLDNPAMLFFARAMVTLPFWQGGIVKLLDFNGAVAEMAHAGLQPALLIVIATLVTEFVGSALILANRYVWLGAGWLGVFTLLSTLIAHRYWEFTGERRFMEMNSFYEHATICAAFILVAVVAIRPPSRNAAP
jgi:transmembrane protein